MCYNPNIVQRPVVSLYNANDDGRTLELKGFVNIKIENTGNVDLFIFDKSVRIKPGIPLCLGVDNIMFGEDTKLEFAAGNNNDKSAVIYKFKIENC
jgi:hypothetical protein